MKTQALAKQDQSQALKSPAITLVVSPRERFSYIPPSLDSIYRHTKLPFDLIYVDVDSPKHLRHYLAQSAAERDFTLLRTQHFLPPNQVRNLALSHVKTKYVLFIDNDIHVSPGWLEHLWTCAQETDATVVAPLLCVGKPLHERILMAGGEVRIVSERCDQTVHRRLYKECYHVNHLASLIQHRLKRQPCEYAELSCVLVEREIFEHIGPFDEKLLSARENIDFCLSIAQAGGKIVCEPTAVVTCVPTMPRQWSDLAYFMLRWSDAWEASSLIHFQNKWQLDMDHDFMRRFRNLGHQRHQLFLLPLLRKLTAGKRIPKLEKLAIRLERWLNQNLTDRHRRLTR